MFKRIFIVILCLLVSARVCLAEGMNAEAISKAFPKSYSGTYVWANSGDTWDASVSFATAKVLDDGTVELSGTEHFVSRADPSQTYDSNVRAIINALTLRIEMEEIYLEKKEGFVPMVYRGNISSDLKNIDTAWIGPKGEKVRLTLKAIATKRA